MDRSKRLIKILHNIILVTELLKEIIGNTENKAKCGWKEPVDIIQN